MRPGRWVCLLLVLSLGCGSSSVELVVVGSGVDGCSYDGPSQVVPGLHSMVMGPSGGGHIVTTVHLIDTDVTTSAIAEHFASGGDPFPDFMTPVMTVERVNPNAFVTESYEFEAGEYVIVCTSVNPVGDDLVRPIGFLTVSEG
ncbi:MAG: hypothetical protein R3258_10420 [Acidimicrobiia bacterium]|nr:hypothetical protein [Acidimicrobiia bacterium]